MRPSQSAVRNTTSNDDHIRDSRSVARQLYDDAVQVRDSQSNYRISVSGKEVPRDSYSVTRDFDPRRVRDPQSIERDEAPRGYEDGEVDPVRISSQTEDVEDGPAHGSEDAAKQSAVRLDKDTRLYTFGHPLPQLEYQAPLDSLDPKLQIYFRSIKVTKLRGSGLYEWNGRMEIKGFWREGYNRRYEQNEFRAIYSHRVWSSAQATRLIAESPKHSKEIISALKRSLYSLSLHKIGYAPGLPEEVDWILKRSAYGLALQEPFMSLASFLNRVSLEAGETTESDWCIGEYANRHGRNRSPLARDMVLRERGGERAAREGEHPDYLLVR